MARMKSLLGRSLETWPIAKVEMAPPVDLPENEVIWELVGGETITNVHAEGTCRGPFCVIHNPSNHHMAEWRQHWRDDRGLMERICPHGIGHPDPDDTNANHLHGCDRCCLSPLPRASFDVV